MSAIYKADFDSHFTFVWDNGFVWLVVVQTKTWIVKKSLTFEKTEYPASKWDSNIFE